MTATSTPTGTPTPSPRLLRLLRGMSTEPEPTTLVKFRRLSDGATVVYRVRQRSAENSSLTAEALQERGRIVGCRRSTEWMVVTESERWTEASADEARTFAALPLRGEVKG